MLRTFAFSPLTRSSLSHSLLRARPFSSNIRFDHVQLTLPGKGSFSYQWLRDSCQCPSCIHPSTLQKLHKSSDIPPDIRPTTRGVETAPGGVHIRWIDGHESFYEASFLERYSSLSALQRFHRDTEQTLWNSQSIRQSPDLFIPYMELPGPSRSLAAINQLIRYGLLFVTGVPNEATSNDACELRTLANIFGEIRTTFYGELWDVKNVHNSRNIAYTNLGLDLHMDLLYFQHPPRYQILHCLRNRVVGGTSIFVDAIYAASLLRKSHPADFDVLAETRVPFHYINDGHHLHCQHPTIELDVLVSTRRDAPISELPIKHINYSPPFQAPLMSSTPPSLYAALRKFAALLGDAANPFEYILREGDAVLFDNRRVLHARTAFTDRAPSGREIQGLEGGTSRWLKGCYLEADAILDRGRMMWAKLDNRLSEVHMS